MTGFERGAAPRHGVRVSRDPVVAAERLAAVQDDVLSRVELVSLGLDRFDIAREVAHGRWAALGRHTIAVHRGPLTERGRWRAALFEVGSHAALDGVSSLQAAGLAGFEGGTVVSVPHGSQPVRVVGVTVHELRG